MISGTCAGGSGGCQNNMTRTITQIIITVWISRVLAAEGQYDLDGEFAMDLARLVVEP